jgi:hypothetical protein
MAPKPHRVCIYCGEKRPTTRDHIPQVCFFPEPLPPNLITVPCCEPCRQKCPEDDEYFKAAVVSSERVFQNPFAEKARDPFLRSLDNPMKRGFSVNVARSVRTVEEATPSGIFIGRYTALTVDRKRIERVCKRITRGLFFHEMRHSVPKHYNVAVVFVLAEGLERFPEKLGRLITMPPAKIVQAGVFSYSFWSSKEDENSTLTLVSFYDTVTFVGHTYNNANSSVTATRRQPAQVILRHVLPSRGGTLVIVSHRWKPSGAGRAARSGLGTAG